MILLLQFWTKMIPVSSIKHDIAFNLKLVIKLLLIIIY